MPPRSPGSVFAASFGVDRSLLMPKANVDTVAPGLYNKELYGERIKELLGAYLGSLRELAIQNEVWKDSYEKLGPGQLRMTVGNRLRAKLNAGQSVMIGGIKL